MNREVSATEARVHFGEMLDDAARSDAPIVVRRGGRPVAVILSYDAFRRLARRERAGAMTRALEEATAVRELTSGEYDASSGTLDQVLEQGRSERDDDLTDLR